jgi:hypothetical protein
MILALNALSLKFSLNSIAAELLRSLVWHVLNKSFSSNPVLIIPELVTPEILVVLSQLA